MTYGDALQTALEVGPPLLVYCIYTEMLEGKTVSDPYTKKTFTSDLITKGKQLLEVDALQLKIVKVYSVKVNGSFHLCLAYNSTGAINCISQHVNSLITKVNEIPFGILQQLHFIKENKDRFLFEVMRDYVEFPVYIGIYEN